ncbi:phosphoglycerate mutase-like protein [Lenzites betulinus]|nr:phosphoglycerate mutase-like protein [Lenzites betulinus]
MTVVARVYIIRHGETDHNREGIMQGQLDTPLNAAGEHQARLAARALADTPLGTAHASDLVRASKTAEIILEPHPGVQLQRSGALRERFMGDWQGGSVKDRGPPPPNLEPLADLAARATKWWNETVGRVVQRKAAELASLQGSVAHDAFEPAHVLMVSHGGLIGTLVTNLVGSRRVRAAEGVVVGRCFNASISVVEVEEDGRGVLLSYADTTHLDVDLVQENADVQ